MRAKQLNKKFGEKDPPEEKALNIAIALQADILEFRENLWIIELLNTEAMKNLKKSKGHWEEIFERADVAQLNSDKRGKQVEMNEDVTLKGILDMGLKAHREIIEEVSRKADKQWVLEKKLKEMEEKVKAVDLLITPYKDTFLLQGYNEI